MAFASSPVTNELIKSHGPASVVSSFSRTSMHINEHSLRVSSFSIFVNYADEIQKSSN